MRQHPIVLVFLLTLALVCPLRGQETASIDAEHDAAVERALAFLSRAQGRDGAWDAGGPKVAMTGLATMAYLSAGHTPELGRYGVTVRNAIDFLLKSAPENGYWGDVDKSRMYGHGIITLALAEAYGVEPDPARREKMRAVLRRAVSVILDAQDVKKPAPHAGGWRYERKSPDSDLSLSGWNALALRACQNIGIEVPKAAVDRAVAYVLTCHREAEKGFTYQPGREATVAMTGVAVLNLYLLGDGEHPSVAPAGQYLLAHRVEPNSRFPYYARYYAAQAAFQVGDPVWSGVWARVREQVLSTQQPDGGWPVSTTGEEPGRIYTTTMSVLTLTVPYRLLPIYQR